MFTQLLNSIIGKKEPKKATPVVKPTKRQAQTRKYARDVISKYETTLRKLAHE
ncbi:MAG: hypothetical protein ACEQSA_04325 [Weeksellaceae bacterium]